MILRLLGLAKASEVDLWRSRYEDAINLLRSAEEARHSPSPKEAKPSPPATTITMPNGFFTTSTLTLPMDSLLINYQERLGKNQKQAEDNANLRKKITAFVKGKNRLTIREVMTGIGIENTKTNANRIGSSLRLLGFESGQYREGKKTVYGFTRKDKDHGV